jgi:hypothetical protein
MKPGLQLPYGSSFGSSKEYLVGHSHVGLLSSALSLQTLLYPQTDHWPIRNIWAGVGTVVFNAKAV